MINNKLEDGSKVDQVNITLPLPLKKSLDEAKSSSSVININIPGW